MAECRSAKYNVGFVGPGLDEWNTAQCEGILDTQVVYPELGKTLCWDHPCAKSAGFKNQMGSILAWQAVDLQRTMEDSLVRDWIGGPQRIMNWHF